MIAILKFYIGGADEILDQMRSLREMRVENNE